MEWVKLREGDEEREGGRVELVSQTHKVPSKYSPHKLLQEAKPTP